MKRGGHSPSMQCAEKESIYWNTTGCLGPCPGEIRSAMCERGLHTLPVLKGKFFNHPRFKAALIPSAAPVKRNVIPVAVSGFLDADVAPLPEEGLMATVLEGIYPRQIPGA